MGFEKIAEDIANGLEEKWDEFLDADGNRKSEMIGATVVEVGLIFLPVGEAKIGIEAVKTALKGSKVAERATDIAKIASLFGRKVSPTTVMNTAKKFTEKFGIKSSNFLKEIAKNETGAIGNLNKVSDLVKKTSDDVAEWIGRDARLIKKDSGDIIVLSKDGNKRFRVDINRTNPHQNPHAHIEELIDGKWIKSGPVYPRDVPHN